MAVIKKRHAAAGMLVEGGSFSNSWKTIRDEGGRVHSDGMKIELVKGVGHASKGVCRQVGVWGGKPCRNVVEGVNLEKKSSFVVEGNRSRLCEGCGNKRELEHPRAKEFRGGIPAHGGRKKKKRASIFQQGVTK